MGELAKEAALIGAAKRTPRSAIYSHDLTSWCHGLRVIQRRPPSRLRHQQRLEHWRALPLEWLMISDDVAALEGFRPLCEQAHFVPPRGQRGGTKWELANVYRLNRLAQLRRELEWSGIKAGHNRCTAAGA